MVSSVDILNFIDHSSPVLLEAKKVPGKRFINGVTTRLIERVQYCPSVLLYRHVRESLLVIRAGRGTQVLASPHETPSGLTTALLWILANKGSF